MPDLASGRDGPSAHRRSGGRATRSRRTSVAFGVALAAALALGLATVLVTGATAGGPAYTMRASAGLTAQPVLGFPATGATVIGASPGSGSTGEVWAEGALSGAPATAAGGSKISAGEVLVHRTDALGNWQIVPVADAQGNVLAAGWTAALVTPGGAVVLAGIKPPSGGEPGPKAPEIPEQVLLRQPGSSAFAPATKVPADALEPGEALSSTAPTGTPVLAAVDEPAGTSVFVAPLEVSAAKPGLLRYEGASSTWRREPVCATEVGGTCTPPSERIVIDGISASSPENAWMVATPAGGTGAAAPPQLYKRVPADGTGHIWLQQKVESQLLTPGLGLALPAPPPGGSGERGALITASGAGVWLDLKQPGGPGSATLFYAAGSVVASWCSLGIACPDPSRTMPADLPAGYGSIVTEAASGPSPGARVITGLPRGAMMALDPGAPSFAYRITIGGESESNGSVSPNNAGGNTFGPGGVTIARALGEGKPAVGGGAAFVSPTDAWLGIGGPTPGPQVAHLTNSPTASSLRSWPLPAPLPLLAIAGQPGAEAAAGNGEAIAVGAYGEIMRFHPGEGWSTESLNAPGGSFASEPLQAPTLRAVAWPVAGEAFAVGDRGTMLRWQSASRSWESDPGKPAGLQAHLTDLAFSEADPSVGYAVGKGGTLLAHQATGAWEPQAPPSGLDSANFSSVTFAGSTALAAYRLPDSGAGGLMVNEGSGWQVDSAVAGLLTQAKLTDPVLTSVAGLPDGGAVAAGPGVVLERDDPSSSWRFSPTPLGELSGGAVSALAAYRDGTGTIRALVSVDPDPTEAPNGPASAWRPADQASPPEPDPMPNQGLLVRETAAGWVDEELEAFPGINEPSGKLAVDQPGWPDGVYALLVDSAGGTGWAVGGQTGGTQVKALANPPSKQEVAAFAARQAGSAARLGPGPSPPVGTDSPFPSPFTGAGSTRVTMPLFAFGGGGGCNAPCADNAGQSLGPHVDLSQAISEAGRIPGLRGFVYAGRGIGWSAASRETDERTFARELGQFSDVLSSGGPGFPVYAVPNGPRSQGGGGDIQLSNGQALYRDALGAHDPVASSVGPAPPAGTAAYAFDSAGAGGPVRMIVLDFSQENSAANQEAWLAAQLADARSAGTPAIVVGANDITDPSASNAATDAAAIREALVSGGASGYVYDAAGFASTYETFGSPGAPQLPAVGIGTLGGSVLGVKGPGTGAEWTSSPGFLLVGVYTGPLPPGWTGPAPLTVEGEIPVVDQVSPTVVGLTVPSGQTASLGGFARSPQGGPGG